MWSLKGKPSTQRVTRALAREFAEMDAAPHDRPLSERRLMVYQKIFAAGGFRPVTWARAHCAETGGTYRVNGKHTSVLLSGLERLPEFYVTLEDYDCESLEDVARLYATFDSGQMMRTARDIYLSFAATATELAEASSQTIVMAAAGMAYQVHQDNISRTQPAERAELLLEHPEFVVWLQSIFLPAERNGEIKPRHIQRQPVVAAMFASWQKSHSAASLFWPAVRDETGPTPSLPDRKLARYLLTVGVRAGRGASRAKSAGPREMYVKCLHAWNAWRKGENTNLQYHANADVPAVK